MNRFVLACTLLTLAVWQPAGAQVVQFSQFNRSLLMQNPSATGYDMGGYHHRFTAVYRNQWEGAWRPEALQSAMASYDFRLCSEALAFGIAVRSDQAGLAGYSLSGALASVAYHQLLGDVMLAAGGSAGLLNYRIEPGALTFNEQYDGAGFNPNLDNMEDFAYHSRFQPDLHAGLMLHGRRFTAGVGLNHLNSPNFSFLGEGYQLDIGMTLHGSYTHPLNKGSNPPLFTMEAFYKGVLPGEQNRQWQLVAGGRIGQPFSRGGRFIAGANFRVAPNPEGPVTLDAFIPYVLLDIAPFDICVSYDANVSRLKTAFTGGLEVSVTTVFGRKPKCPTKCPWEHVRHWR